MSCLRRCGVAAILILFMVAAASAYGQSEMLTTGGYVALKYPDGTVGPLDDHVLMVLWISKYELAQIRMRCSRSRYERTQWLLVALDDKTLALLWPERQDETALIGPGGGMPSPIGQH